jgi:hypothetical protein
MGQKFILTEEDRKSIRGLYGLNEQTNTLSVSGSYTATNCDELHAFQGTGGKVIGNMNVIVGDKIKEWNSNGINVKPTSVNVSVNGMTVNWTVTFTVSDVNWIGFTSRGAGCNQTVDTRAGNDSIDNGPKSVIAALKKQGKTVGKIEIVNDYKYDGGANTFKQVFYCYTLVDNTPQPKPQPKTTDDGIKKFVVSSTDLNTINSQLKTEVSTYITSKNNINFDVDYFDLSSEDGKTAIAKLDIAPNENGYNRFSVLLNPKGKPQESLINALTKNLGSKLIKDGTITINKIEYEYHLIGLYI